MNSLIGIGDFILVPLLLLLIFRLGYIYSSRKYGNTPLRQYFMNGLMLRLAGSIAAGVVFMFYYGSGDTIVYFNRARYLTYVLSDDPLNNWIMFFPELFEDKILYIRNFPSYFLEKENSYMVVRIATFLSVILFESFYAVSIVFAVISFLGSWKLYMVFYSYYPALHKKIAVACLYMPSLVLWGSGILKDTIALSCLGIVVYVAHRLLIKRQMSIRYFVWGSIAFYMLGVTKAYILMALVPSLIFYLLNEYRAKIRSVFIKTTVFPIVLTLVGVISMGALSLLSSTFTSYSIDNMGEKTEGFHRWHAIRSEQTDGSAYSLPEYGSGVVGTLIKFPMAVNVTLFRPYLWEAKKPIVFLSALESFFVLYTTLMIIWKAGLFKIIKQMISNPFISFCVVFALIFAFGVGSTAYNFGALVRFKIPCIPFFMMALYMSQYNALPKRKIRSIRVPTQTA